MISKAKYGNSAFRRGKSVIATANRLCYETSLYLQLLNERPSSFHKTEVSANKYRERVHNILRGEHKLSQQPNSRQDLAAVFAEHGLPSEVLLNLHRLAFEVSKEWMTIFSHLLTEIEQSLSESLHVTVPYLISHYTNPQLAMICGQFFRDLMSFPSHHERCLNLDILKALAEYAMTDHFEISSDAFESFKAMIVVDKEFVGSFLTENYSEVSALFYRMLQSGYFFKRQTLNLVYSILRLPSFSSFSSLYITDTENLKYVMNQLRDESKHIQAEAFYLFNLIVKLVLELSSHERPSSIVKILQKNRERLITFFDNFQVERSNSQTDDDEFQTDRLTLVSLLTDFS
jgi:calcium binding protein 39